MNFNPLTLLDILKAAIGDVTVADRNTFAQIFRDRISGMDPELVTVVFSNLSERVSRAAGVKTAFDITKAHLESVGFKLPEIPLETVFKNFRKGE
jgi:hypothetical protein